MRIIAGKYGGRRLKSFDEDHIRPTTDRVKESIFNILAPRIEGARILDLFAGTGNLGIESLSLGAENVEFVEKNPRSLKIISENLELLKISTGVHQHRSDAVRFVERYQGDSFDIILIDPPFPSRICLTTLEAIDRNPKVTHKESIVVIEHQTQEPLPERIGTLLRTDQRTYGDKWVSFYKRDASV